MEDEALFRDVIFILGCVCGGLLLLVVVVVEEPRNEEYNFSSIFPNMQSRLDSIISIL